MSETKPYSFYFELPGLPKMANGGHGHWRADHAAKKKWKEDTAKALLGNNPPAPLEYAHVTFTRHSSSEPDYDGLVHGFKPIRDALVQCGVLKDDKSKNLTAYYFWAQAKVRQGKVSVAIMEKPRAKKNGDKNE